MKLGESRGKTRIEDAYVQKKKILKRVKLKQRLIQGPAIPYETSGL